VRASIASHPQGENNVSGGGLFFCATPCWAQLMTFKVCSFSEKGPEENSVCPNTEMNTQRWPKPVLGFCAYSGTGKTTLLSRLIPLLRFRGIRVGVIKHAHHNFEIDREGKDSYRFRQAGAEEVLVASERLWVLLHDNTQEIEPDLTELLKRMDLENLDLILVEGLKHQELPKIELHRPSMGRDLMYPGVSGIIALASDEEPSELSDLPLLDLNVPEEVADFIINWMNDR
jgi:molybdopterin-guanine dinucleotide biosynthesis protein MobB